MPVLLIFALTGCGGSGHVRPTWETVATPHYRFQAPRAWESTTKGNMTTASRDGELVQVVTFPLVRAYTPSLFDRVQGELATRMAALAQQTGGRVTGHSVVTAGGIRSHSYDVEVGDHVDEYTFVLRDRREYQLLCRRKSSNKATFCEQLISSFRL